MRIESVRMGLWKKKIIWVCLTNFEFLTFVIPIFVAIYHAFVYQFCTKQKTKQKHCLKYTLIYLKKKHTHSIAKKKQNSRKSTPKPSARSHFEGLFVRCHNLPNIFYKSVDFQFQFNSVITTVLAQGCMQSASQSRVRAG